MSACYKAHVALCKILGDSLGTAFFAKKPIKSAKTQLF